jgi:hypothetical protein
VGVWVPKTRSPQVAGSAEPKLLDGASSVKVAARDASLPVPRRHFLEDLDAEFIALKQLIEQAILENAPKTVESLIVAPDG